MILSRLWFSLVEIYGWAIFAYVMLSWFAPRGIAYDIWRLLGSICEPYISLFRRVLPVVSLGAGGVDLSPMIAWAILRWVIGPVVGAILLRVGL